MPTFRLDKEPWIPVVDLDGTAKEVSLLEAFEQASTLSNIAGSPLESAAITRLLLAIAHLRVSPNNLEEWKNLWNERDSFMRDCSKYVAEQGGVWDLFHEGDPFGQIPGLDKTINPAHLLVYEAARKNNPVHADHSLEDAAAPISPNRLARGIVTTNAFAGSSGGGYRSGPLVMRSVALLRGTTLSETLLLNLLVQHEKPAPYDWKDYGAILGRPPAKLDLPRRYLWTSRAIRLIVDQDECVRHIMLAPGNEMPEEFKDSDPMVIFRLDSQGKKYVPLRLESGRALWRSAHVILSWRKDVRKLASVDQLSRAADRQCLPLDQRVSLRVCSVAGDAQGPSTDMWRDESLPFALSILSDDAKFASLENAINAAENQASETRSRIYSFAARYLQNGAESKPDKNDIGRLADELSPDLGDYWAKLAPMGERIACDDFDERKWAALLKEASENAFRKAVDRLTPDARRFRAEYARRESGGKNEKQGATT